MHTSYSFVNKQCRKSFFAFSADKSGKNPFDYFVCSPSAAKFNRSSWAKPRKNVKDFRRRYLNCNQHKYADIFDWTLAGLLSLTDAWGYEARTIFFSLTIGESAVHQKMFTTLFESVLCFSYLFQLFRLCQISSSKRITQAAGRIITDAVKEFHRVKKHRWFPNTRTLDILCLGFTHFWDIDELTQFFTVIILIFYAHNFDRQWYTVRVRF